MSSDAGVWAAAICTLMVFSYMVDYDNPFWVLIEHVYMGLAFGFTVVYAWQNSVRPILVGAKGSPA